MVKKYVIIGIGVGLIVMVLAVALWYLAVISGAIFAFMPEPPEPEIKYGEFPIKITYELKGQIKTAEDIIVCEYDGIESLGSAGKQRKWKAHLKSGNEHITLLKIDEMSELYCWYGLPEYYMDDLQYESREEYEQTRKRNFHSSFVSLARWENGELKRSAVSTTEAWEKYKLKIIDVQYSPPIQNSFQET